MRKSGVASSNGSDKSSGTSTVHVIWVRLSTSWASHSMAAPRPRSSRMLGRSSDEMRRTQRMVSFTSSTRAATRATASWLLRIDLAVEESQVHAHAGQRLAELIVDLARDAHAFLLAYRLDVGRERAQLLARLPFRLLQTTPLGDVVAQAGGADDLAGRIEDG